MNALFKKSKVRFDQFVAQGKVLHNYASILELLLRLRQCCNHPFHLYEDGDVKMADATTMKTEKKAVIFLTMRLCYSRDEILISQCAWDIQYIYPFFPLFIIFFLFLN